MATWSISPSTASINSSGVATFPSNTSSSSISYTITYTDNNGCSSSVNYTVPSCSPSSCSVNFNVYNNSTTTIGVNDNVEIFWEDMGNSFHFQIGSIAPGSSETVNVNLHDSTASACGKEIVAAYLEGSTPPAGSSAMQINGSRNLNDGTTIYLEYTG